MLDKSRRKDAVKKVIAAMTVGKDVSIIFPDVVNCMQTDDLELKKLVYLYLINYAKSQPDLAIMAVNTFVKVLSLVHQCCILLLHTFLLPIFNQRLQIRLQGAPLAASVTGRPPAHACAQDSQDPNPLIRALAVRTMGCIRVDKITEYLCDPLQRCLKVGAWLGFHQQGRRDQLSLVVGSWRARRNWRAGQGLQACVQAWTDWFPAGGRAHRP